MTQYLENIFYLFDGYIETFCQTRIVREYQESELEVKMKGPHNLF
jgi:hypothetical protein